MLPELSKTYEPDILGKQRVAAILDQHAPLVGSGSA
jgi:hypothetical protein